jgi:hypothetical protein
MSIPRSLCCLIVGSVLLHDLTGGILKIDAEDSYGDALDNIAGGAWVNVETNATLKTLGGNIEILGYMQTGKNVLIDMTSRSFVGSLTIDNVVGGGRGSMCVGFLANGVPTGTTTVKGNVNIYGDFYVNTYDVNNACSLLDCTGYTVTVGVSGSNTSYLFINNAVGGPGPSGTTWTFLKADTFAGPGWWNISYNEFPVGMTITYNGNSTSEWVTRS